MKYQSLALAIAAWLSADMTMADAQSVYVAPGGVYVGGGPVFVIPAPTNGNGYVEPTYYATGYGNGNGYGYDYDNGVLDPAVAPTVVAPGAGLVVAPYSVNGNGYGYAYRNGYGPPRPPVYYNGHPLLSTYASARVPRPPLVIPQNRNGRCIAGRASTRCY